MNYIKEINAFYDLVQVKQLSTGQIALWHALMQINNKCAWIEWFTVPNLTLELTSGLSRKGIYNARNSLKQYGIIDFKSNGTKATSYRLISLLNNTQASTQGTTQDVNAMVDITQGATQGTTQDTTQGTTQDSATLNKLNKTKLNDINNNNNNNSQEIDEEFSQIAKIYQEAGIEFDGFTPGWISDSIEIYGSEWVKNAILEAANQNARNRAYINKILRNWKNWGGMKLGGMKDGASSGEFKRDTAKTYGFTEEDAQRAGVTSL